MKKLILIVCVVLLTALLNIPAHATIKKVAQTGLQFLKVDMSARAAGMGSAYIMTGNDASAMFYNPAGIAYLEKSFDFYSGTTQWIADINYYSAGLIKNFENIGTFGMSVIYCDYGDDLIGTRVDMSPDNPKGYSLTGSIDVGAYAVGLSYAKSLTNKFSVGVQAKYVTQHLGSNVIVENGNAMDNNVAGFAADFGTIFHPGFHSLRVGMSINHFAGQFKYEETAFELPLTFKIGAAMDVLDLMGEHSDPLVIEIDAIHPRDYTERIHLGGEYMFKNKIALRAGYKFNYDEESLSAGIGFKFTMSGVDLKVDYAYNAMDVFDGISRFSIGISR
ncbi:PorV/PorQ family protein [candidate division KSB1 bacterium]|nr:PorV/PorQ family protein [candidate division KSB1 bacterium]